MSSNLNPKQKAILRRWLAAEEAGAAAESWERAIGWTVLCFDGETNRVTVYGNFTDPVEATRHAQEFQAELNRFCAEGDLPYVCLVYPILPV